MSLVPAARPAWLFLAAALALSSLAPAQQKTPQNQGALYVVTYVDVFPEFAGNTIQTLRQFAADSRKDPGSVSMEILQDNSRVNHFTIVETWRDQRAYQTHLALEHTKQFRAALQAWLGSPFDERLYHLLR